MSTITKIKPKLDLKTPPLYEVVYVNDDVTTVQYVVNSLVYFFDYDHEKAAEVAEHVHTNGQASVKVLPFELAEQAALEVTVDARAVGFPLVVKIEPQSD